MVSKNGGKTGVSPLTGLANELNIKDASNRLTLHALSQSVEAPGILSVTGGGLLDWKKKAARSRLGITLLLTGLLIDLLPHGQGGGDR